MIRFIENIGDYYSQHFFTDDFPKKVFDKAGYVTQKKDSDGNKTDNHLTDINAKVSPLRERYYRFKNDLYNLQREKDKVKRTHEFHREVLDVLGYINGTPEYHQPVFLNDTEVIPVRYNYHKGGKPYLFIMEMKAIVREGDKEPQGIYEQVWSKDDWEKVFPQTWGEVTLKPDVIKEALSELFLLPEEDRPVYVVMLAGAKIFLVHYEKWKYDSFLLFDLEELFNESQVSANKDYLALFYALLAKQNFLGETDSLLHSLDEDAHKAAYGVTQNLKKGVIYAVESLANEAIWYKKSKAKTPEEKDAIEKLMADERFARELKDECLTMVYRMLFLFYAEAREDLEILPVKDSVYQKGYSLEMLRDLEMVPLTTDSSRNGYFISSSLWKLFDYLHNGVKTENGFEMKPLDSPLFDNEEMKHLHGVQFRNVVLQQIIKHLSLSDSSKGKRRGRISYANLGINQLGSVYESLLAYSGFFAAEPLIEVKAADDPDGKEGTFLVPQIRRDDFKEEEILKDTENPQYDKQIPKGHFVYRLNGRDRKKSASYYTPEVLTQTTVKYTLKGIIEALKERQAKGEDCADEILSLKILEPAMGAAAFHNEVINQLADAYLELKEAEEVRKGRKRIVPGNYADEMQKVKAYIAANNVYGVDLNPTAVELGKLSLWLNCMHKNMETPFFAHRLGTGNAVVGCWLKVYNEKEVIAEYPASEKNKKKPKPIAKNWWEKAPERIGWNKRGDLTRKTKQFYHFLLPDENMLASSGISLIKEELNDIEKKRVTEWKKEFKQPLAAIECQKIEKLCRVIDTLLEEHYRQITGIIKDTTSAYAVYGRVNPQMPIKGYDEKERLADSRNARSAPYYKLRMVMDYWCSLWFWDARDIVNLPTREQWFNEIENILGVDLSAIAENSDAAEILANIKKHAGSASLFGSEERIRTVEKLREQHRFFHHELEFLEVFKERGGFDVIAGNPPWVKIAFDKASFFSDFEPLVVLRDLSSSDVEQEAAKYFERYKSLRGLYINEEIGFESQKVFFNSYSNYIFNVGGKSNLFRLILENSMQLSNRNIGLVIDEGLFDDNNAGAFRKHLYHRMTYHFRFNNELKLFSEVGNAKKYELIILGNSRDNISFSSICNLFHPQTIESCFNNDDNRVLAIRDEKDRWELSGNNKRVVHYTSQELGTIRDILEPATTDFETINLPLIHNIFLLGTIVKTGNSALKLKDVKEVYSTQMINETTGQNEGIIKRVGTSVSLEEFVFSGPHYYVATPFNKNPNENCSSHRDYSDIDLTEIKNDFIPRTVFKLLKNQSEFIPKNYYHIHRRRTLNTNERTLIGCIAPPHIPHTNNSLSIHFKNRIELVSFSIYSSSIIYDFLIRISGNSDMWFSAVENLPFFDKPNPLVLHRGLRLNCLTELYAELWNDLMDLIPKNDSFSNPVLDSSKIRTIGEWMHDTPVRLPIERRQALLEIDVLVAMEFGLKLSELISLYKIQFPVLSSGESKTYFDKRGHEVPSNIRNQYLEDLGNNQPKATYDSYVTPFSRFDRIEDYKTAWAHFEKIFNNKEQ